MILCGNKAEVLQALCMCVCTCVCVCVSAGVKSQPGSIWGRSIVTHQYHYVGEAFPVGSCSRTLVHPQTHNTSSAPHAWTLMGAVYRSKYETVTGHVTAVDRQSNRKKRHNLKLTSLFLHIEAFNYVNTEVFGKINVYHPGINPRAQLSWGNCWRAIRLDGTVPRTLWMET